MKKSLRDTLDALRSDREKGAETNEFKDAISVLISVLDAVKQSLTDGIADVAQVSPGESITLHEVNYIDVASLVFKVPSTIHAARSRWGAIRFLVPKSPQTPAKIFVYISSNSGALGNDNLVHLNVLNVETDFSEEYIEDQVNVALQKIRLG